MDNIKDALTYLAQADADTRAALVAIATQCDVTMKNDSTEPQDSAVATLLALIEHPLAVAAGLMSISNGVKRGRPRGSKNRKAAA